LFSAGRFDEASINYRKAIQKNPNIGEAHYKLALVDFKLKFPSSGDSELLQALQLMPNDNAVLIALGEFAITAYSADPRRPKQMYDQALMVTDRLLREDPNGFDATRLKGSLFLIDRKPAEAVEYLRRANRAQPDDQQTALGLAQALLESGREQEGSDLARSLIRKDKAFAAAYDLLAGHYATSGKAADAEEILKLKVVNNPGQSDFVIQLSRFYAASKNSALVSSSLQTLLDRPSQFPDAYLKVAEFYNSMGRQDEAFRLYQEGLLADPRNKRAYRKGIIQVLGAQRKWAEAYNQVDLLLREQPNDNEARLIRASMFLEEGKPENLEFAISEFRAQLAGKPANSAVLNFQLGVALERKGDRDGARHQWFIAAQTPGYLAPRFALAELSRAEGKTEDALRISEEILSVNPGDQSARLLHATCLTAARRFSEARRELRRLSADFPQSTAPRFQLAVVDLYEKNYTAAEAAFLQLRTQMPTDDPAPAIGLAETYARQSRSAEAVRLVREELGRNPKSIPLHTILGHLAADSAAYDLAVEQFKQVAAATPASVDAQIGIAQAYIAKGDLNSAIELLERANRNGPGSPATAMLLAQTLEKAGRVGDAKESYRGLLAVAGDNVAALNNLAFLMAETGDNLDEARDLAERALRNTGNDRKARTGVTDTLGWIYLKKRMYANALLCFQRVLIDDPSNPTYHYHLGAALLEKGDTAKARLELQAALAAKPRSADESKIRDLLKPLL
jgi:predicted Zn-dependent protease